MQIGPEDATLNTITGIADSGRPWPQANATGCGLGANIFSSAQGRCGFGLTGSYRPPKISFARIPHRQLLYAIDLVRGELTVLASPGGVGKTSYAIATCVAGATGRKLLGDTIFDGPHTILYMNAEDSRVEMLRRISAFCLKHQVSEQELGNFLLFGADDWQVQLLSLLRAERGTSALDQPGLDHLETLLEETRPDIVVLDPLVALCGGANFNDNGAMSLVMRALKRLATKFGCAILILHHNKKGGDGTDAESVTGAAAIVNLARRALMAVPMRSEEAKNLGVLPSQSSAYFRVVASKSNLAPRSNSGAWYRLDNIPLPNAEPPTYQEGDRVQAVVRVQLPLQMGLAAAADDQAIRGAILDVVERGKLINGVRVPYSPNVTGAKNLRSLLEDAIAAAQRVITQQRPAEDVRAIVEGCIRSLRAEGALVQERIGTGRFRGTQGLVVDRTRVPPNADDDAECPAAGAMGQCHE